MHCLSYVKYLGEIIDNNLLFDKHIKMLKFKVALSVGILSKLKYYSTYLLKL